MIIVMEKIKKARCREGGRRRGRFLISKCSSLPALETPL
jgi:hypothetical protein